MTYSFTVPLVPRGKAAVVTVIKDGKRHSYKNAATADWMTAVTQCAAPVLSGVRLEGPLRIDIVAVFPRSKELLRLHGRGPNKGEPVHGTRRIWYPHRPDKDNLEKGIFDALKPWMPDDGIVVCGDTLKVYASMDEAPHLEVYVGEAPCVDSYMLHLGLSLSYASPFDPREDPFTVAAPPAVCPDFTTEAMPIPVEIVTREQAQEDTKP